MLRILARRRASFLVSVMIASSQSQPSLARPMIASTELPSLNVPDGPTERRMVATRRSVGVEDGRAL